MDKPIACFECSSNGVKLLVGYCLNGEPYCIYRSFIPLPFSWKDGFMDEAAYLDALRRFNEVDDAQAKVRISITEVATVLPAIGMRIFQNEQSSGTTSSDSIITKLDISNVVSLVRKQQIPDGLGIVDIVPDEFIIDGDLHFKDPPFGQRSENITMRAKIHTIPESSLQTHNNLYLHAPYRIKAQGISTYCLCEWIRSLKDMPASYLLVDMGAKTTSVSLIGNHTPYDGRTFFCGGNDLTNRISEAFKISLEEAETLKQKYGYDERKISYDPYFEAYAGPKFVGVKYKQSDLNKVIEEYFKQFSDYIYHAISDMLSRYKGAHDRLPIVLTGGASTLNGIDNFFTSLFPGRQIVKAKSKTIGCLDEGYGSLLGLLLAASQYKGSLNDYHNGMASVSRVPTKKEKPKKVNPEDDQL